MGPLKSFAVLRPFFNHRSGGKKSLVISTLHRETAAEYFLPEQGGGMEISVINVVKIVNTHALRGEVRALHFTDGDDFFKAVKTLYSADGSRSFKIEDYRFHKGAVLLKFAGVNDAAAAEALKGIELYVREEDLPPLPEGRFYFFELIGLKAVLPNGDEIGRVTSVTDGAGGELIEIERPTGKKCLVPKCDAFVKEISLERGEIIITPIEGLID